MPPFDSPHHHHSTRPLNRLILNTSVRPSRRARPAHPDPPDFCAARLVLRRQARAGYYGAAGAAAARCEEGAYCPEGALEPKPCPQFTTSPAGAGTIDECEPQAGYRCVRRQGG